VVVIVVIFITGLPGIFALPAEKILFNPQVYKQALAEEGAYQQFPALVGEMIARSGNVFLFGNGDRLLQALKRSNYEAIVRQIFPDAWVRGQADGLVDQFWAYFNFQQPQFGLVVDFRPIKARLEGEQAPQISAGIVAGFPPCNEDEILNWGMQALQGNVDSLPLCKPPDQLLSVADLLAAELLKGTGAAMPDELDVAAALKLPLMLSGQPVSSAWNTYFGLYRFYRQVNPWLLWVTLGLLALAGFLAWGTPRGMLFWLGVGLALPGFIALVLAVVGEVVSSQLAPLIVAQVFGADVVAFNLLAGMLARVAGKFLIVSAGIALVVTLVGVLLTGIGLARSGLPTD
jgi:hypothetical protein